MASQNASAKHVILVLSGKGGVGKSTVSSSLALALAMGSNPNEPAKTVGILDIDLTGPSIPRILGVSEHRVHQGSKGWVPVQVPLPDRPAATDGTTTTTTTTTPASKKNHLACMSIGFLLQSPGDAVIWRGPKKTAMIRQFLQDVDWGSQQLDYLIVDTPPGTGDEHIALVENLREGWNVDGAVLVTTPQDVSVADVRKELSFCLKVGIKVLGIVENMSGYVCPHCSECTNLFSKGGGESLAKEHNLPFLGYIPIDPTLVSTIESRVNVAVGDEVENHVSGYVAGFAKSGVHDIVQAISAQVIASVEGKKAE
ncbi:P-loop containing nucleoside triphosphate hydrolase protein [Chytriomyces cf. hyalinus JEL632]|nr:P-loop containing nucleoside triphosphate hydrolase protein [Chytriomyces cf. hyalinus JEL632]